MPRNLITFVDSPQIHLENILLVMEKVTFGKDLAAKIVGDGCGVAPVASTTTADNFLMVNFLMIAKKACDWLP